MPAAPAPAPAPPPPSSVTVCIRLRPFLPREKPSAAAVANGNTVSIQVGVDQLYGAQQVEQRQFVFDICLGQEVGQEELYRQLGEPVLERVLEGFPGTLFAYGQTGSGKSYSITGTDASPGIIPQLAARLFDVAADGVREELRVSLSYLEIYNEELKDLLDPRPRRKKLYVHNHPKHGVYVPHLTEAAVTSTAECLRLLDFGAKIRATAQTNMNSTSSRSHSVLCLRVTQVLPGGRIRSSSANLCDLAGSERAKKTGAQGQRMREGSSINSSLSVLGQCISKLAAGAERRGVHVPFRQSKLTHLLTDALSGNSVTTMLANVSPAQSEVEESLSTLRFAESVKKVRTNPQLIEMAPEEPELLLESFRSEIGVLQEALRRDSTLVPSSVSEHLSQALDASEQLMQSMSRHAGPRWAQAVEQTRALEAVQRQLLEDMRLPVLEVGQLAGVEGGTPYLLNVSDDPALSGCLLYFLRAEPDVSTVGRARAAESAGSAGAGAGAGAGAAGGSGANSIVLAGLGIPDRLAEFRYRPGVGTSAGDSSITVRKVCDEASGRLLVNGKPLVSDVEAPVRHGDRIVFGWAFCFRLIVSGTGFGSADGTGGSAPAAVARTPAGDGCFETASREVLEYSMTTTMSGMGVMRAAAQWQSEFQRLGVSTTDAEQMMESTGELMVAVEEANVLCRELAVALLGMPFVHLDVGLCFGFLAPQRFPGVVIQVWDQGETHAAVEQAATPRQAPQLLAAWPPPVFERRLAVLRDAHREAVASTGGDVGARTQTVASRSWWLGEGGGDVPEGSEQGTGGSA